MKFSTKKEGEFLRIIAETDFVNVLTGAKISKGDFGGLIKDESNLDHAGTCWIDNTSKITSEKAVVMGDSFIEKDSIIGEEMTILTSMISNSWITGKAEISNCWIEGCTLEDLKESKNSALIHVNTKGSKFTGAYVKDAAVLNESVIANAVIKSGFCNEKNVKGVHFEIPTAPTCGCVSVGQLVCDVDQNVIGVQREEVIEFITGCSGMQTLEENVAFIYPLLVASGVSVKELNDSTCRYSIGEHDNMFYVECRDNDNGNICLCQVPKEQAKKDVARVWIGNSVTYTEYNILDINKEEVLFPLYAATIGFATAYRFMENHDAEGKELKEVIAKYIAGDMDSIEKSKADMALADAYAEILKDTTMTHIAGSLNLAALPKNVTVLAGEEFTQIASSKAEKAAELLLGNDELCKKYRLNPDREYTEQEKAMLKPIPDYVKVTPFALKVAGLVKNAFARPAHRRVQNILFEGDKGTGKTQLAGTLASLWGLPKATLTCFSNMTEEALKGSFQPNAPEVDITSSLEERIEFYNSVDGKNAPEFIFMSSQFANAIENGWLIEIQEPTCINDAAVLIVLNSILEKDGQLDLGTRIIKRHPEAIVVITTNRSYEGCRPLNQALRDRMDKAFAIELPSADELAERVCTYTGCTDAHYVLNVVQEVEKINRQIKTLGLNDSISQRGLNNFISDIMDGENVEFAVDVDLLNVITTDEDDLYNLKQFVVTSTALYGLNYSG